MLIHSCFSHFHRPHFLDRSKGKGVIYVLALVNSEIKSQKLVWSYSGDKVEQLSNRKISKIPKSWIFLLSANPLNAILIGWLITLINQKTHWDWVHTKTYHGSTWTYSTLDSFRGYYHDKPAASVKNHLFWKYLNTVDTPFSLSGLCPIFYWFKLQRNPGFCFSTWK